MPGELEGALWAAASAFARKHLSPKCPREMQSKTLPGKTRGPLQQPHLPSGFFPGSLVATLVREGVMHLLPPQLGREACPVVRHVRPCRPQVKCSRDTWGHPPPFTCQVLPPAAGEPQPVNSKPDSALS